MEQKSSLNLNAYALSLIPFITGSVFFGIQYSKRREREEKDKNSNKGVLK